MVRPRSTRSPSPLDDAMNPLQKEQRSDWRTAQIVDAIICYLGQGGSPGFAHDYMNMHLVPRTVQLRVLGNTAVIRHRC